MKKSAISGGRLATVLFGAAVLAVSVAPVYGARTRSDVSKEDYKANDMLKRGMELLELNQEDRGTKMVSSIPRMFPKSPVRFSAHLALGTYYLDRHQYTLAIKQFRPVADADEADPEQRAEALYQIGVCYYHMASYDQAFMTLREVTNDYAWSVFANEAYYYIGLCYFKQKRWSKAYEALKMVGTSVPPTVQGDAYAEAGQRFYVKMHDKDLAVQQKLEDRITVAIATAGGDSEEIVIEALDRAGEFHIGSIQTVLAEPTPNDGLLQITGRDTVTTTYVDANTESGKRDMQRLAETKMVSTASIGFTDGAYQDYTRGVFGDSDCFIRLKDLDLDAGPERDTVRVRLFTRFKVQDEEDAERKGVDLSEEGQVEYETRDSMVFTLTETEPRSGMFTGSLVPTVVENVAQISDGDQTLSAMKGDEIVVEYVDALHIQGEESRVVSSEAKLLMGQIQDVKVEHRVVDTLELKARKNLIEAKLYLKLGEIFKEVGLLAKAAEKADEGLVRADEIISLNLKASLDRSIVEEAFSVKWNLLLVKDELGEAIRVCQTLIRLYPDSSLADEALFKIAVAKVEEEDYARALQLLGAVLRLPNSELRAEAQFKMAEIQEERAIESAKVSARPPDLSSALRAYQRCAENYPQSPFAGDSLEKIANYYLSTQDYGRTIELLERIFQDYPDASFLDRMLLKWAFVAYKMGNYQLAKQKTEQFLAEFPASKDVDKAKKLLPIIEKKL